MFFSNIPFLQAMEEVEKNIVAMKVMLAGDGEVEPNPDQVAQLTLEVCNEDVIALFIHKLLILGWEVCFSILSEKKFNLIIRLNALNLV